MREEGHVQTRAELRVMQLQIKERQGWLASHQKLGRSRKDCPQNFRGSLVLLVPESHTFWLQNW